jgi:hypothetical protein
MSSIRSFFFRPIHYFTSAGVGRDTNDSSNKSREAILTSLHQSTEPSLQVLRAKWIAFLQTLCPTYDDVTVTTRGGRGYNYDFLVSFSSQGTTTSLKCEFKHNVSRIDNLPEYFSPAADKPYLPRLYADSFYDTLDHICEIYPEVSHYKPDRETYVRLVHNDDYDRHPFFRALYDAEVAGTREQYIHKQKLVRESISTFLKTYVASLDLKKLSDDIRERQSGKVFILWDTKEFHADTIRDDEMDITHVEDIKNGNTIVAVSKAGTKHNMLLRWKNHLGILYPAWQISLTR